MERLAKSTAFDNAGAGLFDCANHCQALIDWTISAKTLLVKEEPGKRGTEKVDVRIGNLTVERGSLGEEEAVVNYNIDE